MEPLTRAYDSLCVITTRPFARFSSGFGLSRQLEAAMRGTCLSAAGRRGRKLDADTVEPVGPGSVDRGGWIAKKIDLQSIRDSISKAAKRQIVVTFDSNDDDIRLTAIFPGTTRLSRYQNVSILDFVGAKD